jgi:cardiolipin synthase
VSGPDRGGVQRGAEGGAPERPEAGDGSLDRIATVPNALSALRIAVIPVFVWLILHEGTEAAGLLLLGITLATDWVDGYIARRTGQVSNLGKVLDPVADRLAIAAGLIAVVIAGAFPLWAALLILLRDAIVLVAGVIVSVRWHVRIDVRWIGKAATLALMVAVPMIAWANFGLALAAPLRVVGWGFFAVGIVLYYAAASMYAVDMRDAVRRARRGDGQQHPPGPRPQ